MSSQSQSCCLYPGNLYRLPVQVIVREGLMESPGGRMRPSIHSYTPYKRETKKDDRRGTDSVKVGRGMNNWGHRS